MRNSRRSPFLGLGIDRFNIFVPAIMSVGAAFWLLASLRDLVAWRRDEALSRRSSIAGRGAGQLVRVDGAEPQPEHIGLRHRGAYLLIAAAATGMAAYVFFGSFFNYRRVDGYLEHSGVALALGCVVSAGALLLSAAALGTWGSWPTPAKWIRALDHVAPLSRLPLDLRSDACEPAWPLTSMLLALPTAAITLSFLVATEWEAVLWIDEQLADWIGSMGWAGGLKFLDPMGSAFVAIALAMLVAVSSLRCRPLAVSYPLALGLGLATVAVTQAMIGRPAPDVLLTGRQASFPSANVMLATLLAGLVPLAIASLAGRLGLVTPLRVALGLGVIGSAISRIQSDTDWPSDVAGGLLVGLALVCAVQWTIDHESWHRWCRGCCWAPESHGPALRGVFNLHLSSVKVIRTTAHVSAAVAVVVLTVFTVTVGLPTSPDGAGLGFKVQLPVQLALAGLVSIGALVSWKSEAIGASLIALGGAGLGVFAAVEYSPLTAFSITLAFAVPAVLLWLAWQHRRTMAEIITLAVVMCVLLGATWAGASAMHDYWFGPTHPDSSALWLPADKVAWVWLGDLDDEGISMTAGLVDAGPDARVAAIVEPVPGGATVRSTTRTPDTAGIVRLRVDGLAPDTQYRYHIEVDGERDELRGTGSFTTAPAASGSFTVVVGACARTDSNGAVFDSIRAIDPLLYLNLGDIHYSNLSSTDPEVHRSALTGVHDNPGQAALYRQVPIAYVWDDHDYGPNDADASSPGRSAVREAYRQVVPHYDLAERGDAPIHQAFTIGRVRFVLTDSRSERTEASMLGDRQLAWLIEELTTASATHGLVVWGNSVPWIGDPTPGGDNWNGYAAERQTIADALAEAGVDNLVMAAGDAHMVALDDGTNTDYSTDQVGGFPLLHSAALDRRGSIKGGPYTSGTFPGSGQFGTIEVDDDGTSITVTLAGHTWEGDVLVEETFVFGAQ